MNEPTWFQRVNDALKRRYGIQGDGPVTTFASDAFPTINVDDDHLSAELHYLAQSRLGFAAMAVSPAALEYGAVVLENPAASGAIVVCERIAAYTAAGIIRVAVAGAIAASITVAGDNQGPRDTRDFSAVGTWRTLTARVGTLATAAQAGVPFGVFPNQAEILTGPWVLRPGSQLIVGGSELNTVTYVQFSWRERAVNTWELSQ